jgi:hypothetical protein
MSPVALGDDLSMVELKLTSELYIIAVKRVECELDLDLS